MQQPAPLQPGPLPPADIPAALAAGGPLTINQAGAAGVASRPASIRRNGGLVPPADITAGRTGQVQAIPLREKNLLEKLFGG